MATERRRAPGVRPHRPPHPRPNPFHVPRARSSAGAPNGTQRVEPSLVSRAGSAPLLHVPGLGGSAFARHVAREQGVGGGLHDPETLEREGTPNYKRRELHKGVSAENKKA